jgi:hypothetical protein
MKVRPINGYPYMVAAWLSCCDASGFMAEAFYFLQDRKPAMSIKKRFSSKSTIASPIVRRDLK